LKAYHLLSLVLLASMATACTFKTPDANKPLGCLCNARPNAYAYCQYDACNYAGCKAGYFDLDQQPGNGCETARSQLPGNMVFSIFPGFYLDFTSELTEYAFLSGPGIATVTASDPACKATATQRCAFRLEAFQVPFAATTSQASQRSSDLLLSDLLLGTTRPLDLTESGNGAAIVDPSAFSASFGTNGDRAPLLDAKGSLNIFVSPTPAGTARINIEGYFRGYVSDRVGTLSISLSGNTPQLFDASFPDEAGDAATEATGDAVADVPTDVADATSGPDD
jgi:hypothetical protein